VQQRDDALHASLADVPEGGKVDEVHETRATAFSPTSGADVIAFLNFRRRVEAHCGGC
jgi:hypothetical protein